MKRNQYIASRRLIPGPVRLLVLLMFFSGCLLSGAVSLPPAALPQFSGDDISLRMPLSPKSLRFHP